MKSTRNRSSTRAIGHPLILAAIAVIAAAGFVMFMLTPDTGGNDHRGRDMFTAERGSFFISIPAAGELAAMNQIEVRNRLDGRAVITEIAAEGQVVRDGDVLLRFNDEDIITRIDDAVDAVDSADNQLVNARSILDIRNEVRASELDKADLAIRLAELALLSWEEGEDVSRRKELALKVETAQKNYDRLHDRFMDSRTLLDQKFISEDQYKQDEIAMIEASATLEQARLNIMVYEKYEYEQEKATKESDLQQAREERVRVEQRYDAEVRSGESDVRSAEHQLESQRDRLKKLREQFEYCTITAPSDGLVVYASSLGEGRHWRGEQQGPQVGSEISRNELILVLPDTSKMVAEVKVNEALSGMIEPGQRATVLSDAVPDAILAGDVRSVGVLAESGGWRDPNRRDYTVRIDLEGTEGLGLKPSMRCVADIFIGEVSDAIFVPVQALKHDGGQTHLYVAGQNGFLERPVTRGRASELFVEILEGLEEGERVLLRQPGPQEILREESVPAAAGDVVADAGETEAAG